MYKEQAKLLLFITGTDNQGSTPTRLFKVTDEINAFSPDLKAHCDYDRQQAETVLLNAVTTSPEDPFDFHPTRPEQPSAPDTPVNIGSNVLFADEGLACKLSTAEDDTAEDVVTMSAAAAGGGDYFNNNYVVIDCGEIMDTDTFAISPNSEYEEVYYDSVSPVTITAIPKYENLSDDDDADENLVTVNSFNDVLLRPYSTEVNSNDNSISSCVSDVTQQNCYSALKPALFDTPENSRSASDYSYRVSPALSLVIDGKFKNPGELSTPDVIESINSIELESDFNILNFVNDEVRKFHF